MVEKKKVSIEFKTNIDVAVMEKIHVKLPINTVRMAKYYIDKSKFIKFPLSTVHNNLNLYYKSLKWTMFKSVIKIAERNIVSLLFLVYMFYVIFNDCLIIGIYEYMMIPPFFLLQYS